MDKVSVSTHWKDCWTVHHGCAIKEIDRLVVERDDALDTVDRLTAELTGIQFFLPWLEGFPWSERF